MKRKHDIGCKSKTSPLYELLSHQIKRRYQSRFDEKIMPWSFFNCGTDKYVEYYNGTRFNVGNCGLKFSGSIYDHFWEPFIIKFIEDDIQEFVTLACELSEKRDISPLKPLEESRIMLKQMSHNLFHNMAHADQLIRGQGYPNKTVPVSIERYVEWANAYIDQKVDAEIKADDFSARMNRFSTRYKPLYGLCMAFAGAIIGLFARNIYEIFTK